MTTEPALTCGAPVVEIVQRPGQRPWLTEPTTVQLITPTLIVTADGRKWNITGRWPLAEGRNSGRRLVSVHDDRAILARAREMLNRVAGHATNLRNLPRSGPEDIVADLASIVRAATEARRDITAALIEARQARNGHKP